MDEFERKLAEMESELDHDVEESSKAVDDGRPGSALRRGGGEWDLSPGTARAGNESFQEVAQVANITSFVNPTGPSTGLQRHLRYEHYQIGPRKG